MYVVVRSWAIDVGMRHWLTSLRNRHPVLVLQSADSFAPVVAEGVDRPGRALSGIGLAGAGYRRISKWSEPECLVDTRRVTLRKYAPFAD